MALKRSALWCIDSSFEDWFEWVYGLGG
jgi:hypothetical protein